MQVGLDLGLAPLLVLLPVLHHLLLLWALLWWALLWQ
jgi:hypothetical protein